MTATSARTPETISSTRSLMGCDITRLMPGSAASRSRICSAIPSCVMPRGRSSNGVSEASTSASLGPAGSAGDSPRPNRDTTFCHARNLQHQPLHLLLHLQRFVERDIRHAVRVGRKRALLHLRDERRAKKGKQRQMRQGRATITASDRASCDASAPSAAGRRRACAASAPARCRLPSRPSAGRTKAPEKA